MPRFHDGDGGFEIGHEIALDPTAGVPGWTLKRTRKYVDAALAILESGSRPTAERLVEVIGGSKSDSVKAMAYFWAVALPARLSTIEAPKPPTEVERALTQVWNTAKAVAAREHAQALTEAQAAVEAALATAARAGEDAVAIIADRDHWKGRCAAEEARASHESALRQQHENLIPELRRQLEAAHSRLEAAAGEISELKLRVRGLEEKLHDLPDLEGQLERALAAREEANAALRQLDQTRNEDLQRLQDQHQTERERIEGLLTAARNELATASADHARAKEEVHRLTAEASTARGETVAAETRAAVLQAQLDITSAALDVERSLRTTAVSQLGQATAMLEAAQKARKAAEEALERAKLLNQSKEGVLPPSSSG